VPAAAAGDPRLAAARAALDQKDYRAALRLCELARREGVPPVATLELETEIFKQTEYLDREIETLRQWQAAAPQDAQPWLRLFYIYLDLGWRRRAAEASEQALRLAPGSPRSRVTRALVFYRSNEPALGVPPIDEAIRLDPTNLEQANLKATILLKAKRFPEAEAVARAALARDPRRPANRMVLAQALLGQHKTAEAAAELREVEKSQPGDIAAIYELGVLAEKERNLPEATRQFERAAAIDAQYSKLLWHLGRVYMQTGREEQGKKLLKTFQQMDANTNAFETALARLDARPDDPQLHAQLARFHLNEGELPAAVVELRAALARSPHDARIRRELAAALARQGRATEAKELMNAPPVKQAKP
jgi:predicted Zn-dependent protease